MDNKKNLNQTSFHLLLLAVSIALCLILLPFFSTILWAAILAMIFQPVQHRLLARLGRRRNVAALVSLLICVVLVILPLMLVAATLVQEVVAAYTAMKSGGLNFGEYFNQMVHMAPTWLQRLLDRLGVFDLHGLQQKLTAGAAQISHFLATQALSIGQNTLQFLVSFGVMLYLFFFLVRDGQTISRIVRDAIPLDHDRKQYLLRKFTTVIRATVKGNVVVALVQGTLGGLAFWVIGIEGALLWGALMALLSLLPAIGAALVWAPVAIYFMLTGALTKGIGLFLFCSLVIGTVDNVLRPVLVGKDTRMPDWVILISTLGGMSLIGINGFVIGPLVAALFIACWDLFARDKREAGNE